MSRTGECHMSEVLPARIGLLSGWPPIEPWNFALPKAKMPPSEPTM